jgi:riboflavin transporter FmnP
METKTIAIIAIFTALSVALILSPFKVPALPPVSFLFYQIWEIPIVAALLLFGPLVAVTIAIINTTVLLVAFPGASPTGPIYNLAANLSMLLGIYISNKLILKIFGSRREALETTTSTILGIVSRVGLMTIVNYAFIRYPPPVGFSLSEEAIMFITPFVGFFNATLALYTIPIGYVIARAVSLGIITPRWGQR